MTDPATLRLHGLHNTIMGLMTELKQDLLLEQFKTCLRYNDLISIHPLPEGKEAKRYEGLDIDGNRLKGSYVGQLSCKLEAAGKIRVFAMVDVWTQSVLSPLHEFLFSFLKSLPNDATFDQEAAVKRCFAKVERSGISFGYDLSAATDRLPISLQVAVLGPLVGIRAARL